MTPRELPTAWRTEAGTLEKYGDTRGARLLRDVADVLEASLRSVEDEPLDLSTAARESGYSADRLRHLVSSGEIPNAGKKGAPRIRRGDLPRKARASAVGFDASAVALSLVQPKAS